SRLNVVFKLFSNLKVLYRLYLSYGIILVILLVVGFTGLMAFKQLTDVTHEIYEERLMAVSTMTKLSAQFEQLNSTVAGALMSNTLVTEHQIENINQLLSQTQHVVQEIMTNYEQYEILEQDAKTFQIIWDGYVAE